MGNKINLNFEVQKQGKEMSTEKLKSIYCLYSKNKDLESKISKKKAIKFIQNLFEIYKIPIKNDENVISKKKKKKRKKKKKY